MKILAFDIWADFGHFKKYYTTSTPLTFSIPPKTAVFGIIGAILGFEKDEYLKFINGKNTKVGIQILKPIRKTRFTLNYIDTKNSNSFHLIKVRTQIKTEFLKEPAYRLFINHSDEKIFDTLINKVKNKESHYTVSMGLAGLLANFKYVNVFSGDFLDETERIDSVIYSKHFKNLDIEKIQGLKILKEKIPVDMNSDREVLDYKDIIMELNGKPIFGKFRNCYKIKEKNIINLI